MKYTYQDSDHVSIEMTHEELMTLRYTLSTGVEKLEGTAHYLRSTKDIEANNATETARKAQAVAVDLEKAVQG